MKKKSKSKSDPFAKTINRGKEKLTKELGGDSAVDDYIKKKKKNTWLKIFKFSS